MRSIRAKLTENEKRLFREAVIREYKNKHETQIKKPSMFNIFLKKLRKIAPINIMIGIAACVLVVYLEGWMALIHMIMYSVIWITLISAILTAFMKGE